MSAGGVRVAKKLLRTKKRAELKKLSPELAVTSSSIICKKLLNLFSEVSKENTAVMSFEALFPGEVSLDLFHKEISEVSKIFIPKECPTSEIGWQFEEYSSSGGNFFFPKEFQEIFVILPGLAFSLTGNRLGRGKGFYDRFLNKLPETLKLKKIGVCLEVQLESSLPTEPHDLRTDFIVTESEVYDCLSGVSF